MNRGPDLIHRAVRQVRKATERGDLDSALRWIIVVERQLNIIERLAGVARHRSVWRVRDQVLAALAEASALAATPTPHCAGEALAGDEGSATYRR